MAKFLDEAGLAELWACAKEKFVLMDILWENASHTSGFGAQTLSVDLTDCNAVIVNFKYQINMNVLGTVVINKSRSGNTFTLNSYYGSGQSAIEYARDVKVDWSNNTVVFGNGEGNNTTNGSWLIPLEIYAIKGVKTA